MLFAYPGCAEQCCSEGRSMQWRNTAVGDKGAVFHFGGLELGEVAERMHCLVFLPGRPLFRNCLYVLVPCNQMASGSF